MSTSTDNPSNYISLGEIYLGIKKGVNTIRTHFLLVFVCGVLFAGLFFTYALLLKPIYKTHITFFVEEPDKMGGALSSYMNLASQLGLSGGGGAKSTGLSDENVMEMLKSNYIIESALLSPMKTRAQQPELLINYYISMLELRKDWQGAKTPELKNVVFKDSNRDHNTILQDSVIQLLVKTIKEVLLVEKPVKQSNIISVEFKSPDQLLTKVMLEAVVNAVSKSYTLRKTQRARETVDFIQSRADSIKKVLYSSEYSLARFSDANKRLIKAEGSLSEGRMMRDVEMLGVAYAKIVENLELSKVSLLNQTPLIQVVDAPYMPIPREKKLGKLTSIILGGFIGGFLASLFVIVRARIREDLD